MKLGDIAFPNKSGEADPLGPWLRRFDRTNGNTEKEHP
jgi:hypothetical protein